MRKSLAGALIRLAHRIYPPKVTVDHSAALTLADIEHWRDQQEKLLRSVHVYGIDGFVWDIGAGGGGGSTHLPPDDSPAPARC